MMPVQDQSLSTIGDLLIAASQRLVEVSDSPRLDAEMLLAAALNRPRSYLHAWPERKPEPEPVARFAAWLERRRSGEPVAYLLGWRGFWSLELEVTPDTLIPRPETELLVELALARAGRLHWRWRWSDRRRGLSLSIKAGPLWPWPGATPGGSIWPMLNFGKATGAFHWPENAST